jgi:adenylate kinase family enzyme
MLVGIVGPCGAGKSTLASKLAQMGYQVRHIAQEHSYVKDMWKKIAKVTVLIYLDVSYEKTIERRKLNWRVDEYNEQLRRLEHAREHANLIIDTNPLDPEQVSQYAIRFLKTQI